jgi:hypothetical protein
LPSPGSTKSYPAQRLEFCQESTGPRNLGTKGRPDRGSVNSTVLLAFSHMSTNLEFSPADADLTHRLANQVVYPMRMVGRTSVRADHAIGFAVGIVAIKVDHIGSSLELAKQESLTSAATCYSIPVSAMASNQGSRSIVIR